MHSGAKRHDWPFPRHFLPLTADKILSDFFEDSSPILSHSNKASHELRIQSSDPASAFTIGQDYLEISGAGRRRCQMMLTGILRAISTDV